MWGGGWKVGMEMKLDISAEIKQLLFTDIMSIHKWPLNSIKAHHLEIKTSPPHWASRCIYLGEVSGSPVTLPADLDRQRQGSMRPSARGRTQEPPSPTAHGFWQQSESLTSGGDNDLFTFHWIENWRYFIIGSGKIWQLFHATVFFWQVYKIQCWEGLINRDRYEKLRDKMHKNSNCRSFSSCSDMKFPYFWCFQTS